MTNPLAPRNLEQLSSQESGCEPAENSNGSSKPAMEQSIAARFEQIVRQYPNRLAVKAGEQALTYDELNRYANRIARAIIEQRGPGSEPIALLFDDGIDGIAAIFAVLKAGKFFLALSPASPDARNARALADSGAALVVTNARHQALVESLGRGLVSSLDIDTVGNHDPSNPMLGSLPGDIAGLTYTSGSTGEPKGVVQTHRNLLHSWRGLTDEMRITIDDRVSLLHSLSFATAHSNLLAALLNGAALFLFDLKTASHSELASWVCGQKITMIHLPPSSFREFAEYFGANAPSHQLRLIRLSGSPITRRDFELYRSSFPAGTLLKIAMGSTELRGICSAVIDRNYIFPPDGAPIGYARAGQQVVILDELGREVENGQVGEIAVRSKYADGAYWQPGLHGQATALRAAETDERLTITGDLGRKLDDGFVIHLGRKDFMVKIRGYRVEIGETERALLDHPQVKGAGVAAWERDSGENYLAGYVVPRGDAKLNVSQLKEFLRAKLAAYMIPAVFVFLPSLPTTNGKLDRRALPKPGNQRPDIDAPYVSPRTKIEARLSRIWSEVLSIEPVGIHDNFFELGGHSLTASQVISRVIQRFRLDLPIKALFDAPTVTEMAAVIMENQAKRVRDVDLTQMLREVEAMTEGEAQKQLALDGGDRDE